MIRRDTNENRRLRGPRAESQVRVAIRRAVSSIAAVFAPTGNRRPQDVRRSV